MNNEADTKSRPNKLVNWITVWGLIFGCVAFNLYVDNRHSRLAGHYYREQYEVESQRADSLHRAAIQLEQRVQEMESGTVKKASTNQSATSPKSFVTSEL